MIYHRWESTHKFNERLSREEWIWVCAECKAFFKGHWSIGPGAIDNCRIHNDILENCQEEQVKRIMDL